MNRKKLFVLQSLGAVYSGELYARIRNAVHSVSSDIEVFRADSLASGASSPTIIQEIYDAIKSSDFLICDLSGLNANVMYEVGFAHALSKPVFLIAQNADDIPFDLRKFRVHIYNLSSSTNEFDRLIEEMTRNFIANPDAFAMSPADQSAVQKVFISYSHNDTEFLRRLMIHLRPLEKSGLIDPWADTKLRAGDRWQEAIEEALLQAKVAILLITADFLASDFVVDSELPKLLANAEAKGTRIIPVILKPCRYTRDVNLNRFQAINDPTAPLINLSEGQQEKVYDRVAEAVERAMDV